MILKIIQFLLYPEKMYILITYDVCTSSTGGEKRLRKVAKACKNYGQRVQNSVFECLLSESQLVVLQNELANIIDSEEDSIRYYFLGNNWSNKVEMVGKKTSFQIDGELII